MTDQPKPPETGPYMKAFLRIFGVRIISNEEGISFNLTGVIALTLCFVITKIAGLNPLSWWFLFLMFAAQAAAMWIGVVEYGIKYYEGGKT